MSRREELEIRIDEIQRRIQHASEDTPDAVLELWQEELDEAVFDLDNLYDDYETETE